MKKRTIELTMAAMLLFAFATLAKPAQSVVVPGTIIAIDPAVIANVQPGDTFSVNVTISDVPANNVSMWVLSLRWNPAVVNLTQFIEGDYLKKVGSTIFTYSEWRVDEGYLDQLTCGTMDLSASPETSGWLVMFTFKAIAVGNSNIDLTSPSTGMEPGKPVWVDAGGVEYAFDTVTDGSVTVVSEFPAFLVAPIFIAITLVTIVIVRKAWKPKNEYPNTQ